MSHAPFTINIQYRLLAAMLELASTDETRYILCALCLEIHPDQVRLVATDGRRMGVLRLHLHHKCVYNYDEATALVQANAGKPVRLILSRELIEQAAPTAAHKKKKHRSARDDVSSIILTIHDPLSRAMAGYNFDRRIEVHSEGRPRMIFTVITGNYPNYVNSLPTSPVAPAAALSFNPELTVAFSRVAESLDHSSSSVVLRSHVGEKRDEERRFRGGHVGPDIFSVFIMGMPDFYGVLMPVRFAEEEAKVTMETPGWLHARRHIPPYQPRRFEPEVFRQRHALRRARRAERRPFHAGA